MKEFFRNKYLRLVLFLIVISLFSYLLFNQLGSRPIERWDEKTNIEVVKESLEYYKISHNPFSLRLNNSDFFEKPPLWYYITEIFVTIFGENIICYRIISALSAIALFMLIFELLRKHFGFYIGIIGVFIFTTIPHLYINNVNSTFSTHLLSSADIDALQFLLIFLSFFMLFYSNISSRKIFLSYFFLSLAFLVKGPLVLVPLLLNSIYLVLKKTKIKLIIFGILLFLLPILLWLLFMYLNYGNTFINEFVKYHLLSRFSSPLEGHEEKQQFYLELYTNFKVNPYGLISLITMVAYPIYSKFRKIKINKIFIYSTCFVLITFITITIAGTKLAWYLLPVYPFMAIQIASCFNKS